MFTGNTDVGDIDLVVKEQECTPEVLIENGLSGSQALYYGQGQIHVVGILDMHSPEVKKNTWFGSASDLQSLLASEFLVGLNSSGFVMEGPAATSLEGAGAWIIANTVGGKRKIAHVNADVNHFQDIATASITLNLAVPISGIDPDRTCPYERLAAAGIDTPFTTVWALDGKPASDQDRQACMFTQHSLWVAMLHCAMERTIGLDSQRDADFVDHARALGESDPDLESDKEAERGWQLSILHGE